jgi:hypothetical protein
VKLQKFVNNLIIEVNQFQDYMRDNHPEVTDLDDGDWFEQFLAYGEVKESESE